jgi:apolipoprotein N-acyltransferase
LKFKIALKKYTPPFLAGTLLSLAFAPISLVGLGLISLAWLFYQLIQIKTPKYSFKTGWAYGAGIFSAGTSWIYVSIHTYGRADVFSSILVTILFCLFMGFYYGLFGLTFSLCSRLFKSSNLWLKVLNFSVIWVAFEYLRANLFTGFPWLLLGFSQIQTPMKYLAPIVGVYGISFLVAFSGGLLAITWIGLRLKNNQTRTWMPAILCLLSLYCFPQALSFVHWTKPASGNIPVSVIQGNIGEDEKWLPHAYEKTITHYVMMTRRVLEEKIPPAPLKKGAIHHRDFSNEKIHHHDSSQNSPSKKLSDTHLKNQTKNQTKTPINQTEISQSSNSQKSKTPIKPKQRIIVWPEGAIPVPYPQSGAFLHRLSFFLAEKNVTLVTGIPYQNAKNNDQYFNAMLLLGKSEGHYFKHHIVPFGEYFPAAIFHDIMNWLGISLYETGRGAFIQPLLNIQGIATLPFICYEIAYADILFQSLPEAQLFITISDDAWFGRSLARAQHLQIAQMRSLQSGRYQIVATNNGISAIIDAEGNVIKTIPSFETRILNSSIKAMSGSTPWGKVGDNTILLLLFSGWLLIQLLCNCSSRLRKFL